MHHFRKPVLGKQPVHRCTIGQIDLLEREMRLAPQHVEAGLLQRRIVVAVQIVQPDHHAAFRQQPAGDMEADKARGTGDQYCLIRHHILKHSARSARGSVPGLFTRGVKDVAIPSCPAIARLALKPYQGGEVRRPTLICAVFDHLFTTGKRERDAPDPAFDHQDIDLGRAALFGAAQGQSVRPRLAHPCREPGLARARHRGDVSADFSSACCDGAKSAANAAPRSRPGRRCAST